MSPDVASQAPRNWPALVLSAIASMSLCSTSVCAPSITDVVPSSDTAELYDKLELAFQVATVASNPYWPYDPSPAANTADHPNAVPSGVGVSVDGLFLPPGASDWDAAVVQPAFYMLPCEDVDGAGCPVGSPGWRIRFTPTAAGEWRFRIRATDAEGTTEYTGPVSAFTCVGSSRRGFVRVSPNDCRYFETSDGTYLSLCGLSRYVEPSDQAYSQYAADGINLLRPWWNGSQGPVIFGLSGQGGIPGIRQVVDDAWGDAALSGAQVRPGELISGLLALGTNSVITGSCAVEPSTTYRLGLWVKTVGLVTSDGGGLYLQANDCTQRDVPLTTKLTGDNDWTELTGTLVTRPGQTAIKYLKLMLDGRQSGEAYYTDWSLRKDLGGGQFGPNVVGTPSYNKYLYVSQTEAFKADRQVELARQHGIYLKICLQEKDDMCFGNIMPDGTFADYPYHDSRLYANVRAGPEHASRIYQQYFWRYMIARYGYATSIHSFEFANEEDPFDGNHHAAAEAMAKYFNDNDPNKHLCLTSAWHSYPTYEFWANPAYPDLGYSDWHQYVGKQQGSGLQFRYGWGFSNTTGTTVADLSGIDTYLDSSVYASPPCSLFVDGAGYANGLTMNTISIAPGHTYTIRWKMKGQDLTKEGSKAASQSWITGPTVMFVQKRGWWGIELGRTIPAPAGNMGTYDWTEFSYTFTAASNACYINLQPTIQWAVGRVWFDDISLHDDTANSFVAILNGDFDSTFRPDERDSRLDYDSGILNYSIGAMVGTRQSRSKKAPCIRGELGISGDNVYGNPYRGSPYLGENQQLVDDTSGVWYRKLVWSQVNQFGVIDMYWWHSNIENYDLLKYPRAYQAFMAGVPLSNGAYEDAAASVSDRRLRVMGQKDVADGRAHLWIDNAPYTWKAVVDHSYSPEPWSTSVTYAKDSTCGGGSPTHIYKSLQENNKNRPVVDPAWWQDTGAFNAADNPPLPPPVSGTVTLSGFDEGTYKVEWWDTSTGLITATEDVSCGADGKIVLTVQNLQSDIACKIAPPPPTIALKVTVIQGEVVPGGEVTIAVDYTNTGSSEARDALVTSRIPAEMDYVAGTAEATGGTYDPVAKALTWVVDSVGPGAGGRRTYRATVR